jgi:nitroimidazol reductase NimA-like FMN-containing flavoprotein (pyridoxamine 5'-phosphate oxidase superfamily)
MQTKMQLHLVKLGEPWWVDSSQWDSVVGFGTVFDAEGKVEAVIVAFIKRSGDAS